MGMGNTLSQPRRKAAVLGGSAAAMGAPAVLTSTHGHAVVGAACIGVQVLLIVLAGRMLVLSRRACGE